MARQTPYTNDTNAYASAAVDYQSPNPRYAAPSASEDAPYIDSPNWTVTLSREGLATPDHMRLGTVETREQRPEGNEPPERYYDRLDADEARRHGVETIDADGWTIPKEQYKVGRNPRENPSPEPRPTGAMAPRSYFFTRPFDQLSKGNGARQFNSMHFSMAAHRRTYDIHGMAPVRSLRNTYRLDPAPWDTDIVDAPADMSTNVPYARLNVVDLPEPVGTRSWRL